MPSSTIYTPEHAEKDPGATRAKNPLKNLLPKNPFLRQVFTLVLPALLVSFLLRAFVFQMFYIPSDSMQPTLSPDDRVMVEKIDKSYQRGDVVVFLNPSGQGDDYIKRVIGLPGDHLLIHDGNVYLKNQTEKELEEPWLKKIEADFKDTGTYQDIQTDGDVDIVLKENEFWVMGDNRAGSGDSRVFGPIYQKNIIGKAVFQLWPLNKIEHLGT